MRLFVAIDLSKDLREALVAAQRKLADTRADVRWVVPENLHITLKFLGEVDESRVTELLERVQKAAAQVPAFPLEVEGVDRLPAKGPVRVICSRVISPDQRIMKLHRLVDSAAGCMGLPLDTRVYVPHLTLGRVSSNHGLNRLLRLVEKHDLDFFGSFVVEHVTLYESVLGAGENSGPQYVAAGKGFLETPAAGKASDA